MGLWETPEGENKSWNNLAWQNGFKDASMFSQMFEAKKIQVTY